MDINSFVPVPTTPQFADNEEVMIVEVYERLNLDGSWSLEVRGIDLSDPIGLLRLIDLTNEFSRKVRQPQIGVIAERGSLMATNQSVPVPTTQKGWFELRGEEVQTFEEAREVLCGLGLRDKIKLLGREQLEARDNTTFTVSLDQDLIAELMENAGQSQDGRYYRITIWDIDVFGVDTYASSVVLDQDFTKDDMEEHADYRITLWPDSKWSWPAYPALEEWEYHPYEYDEEGGAS